MATKTVMCPRCKNKVTVQVNPGEKTYITCPKCNTKGVFTFPEEETIVKKTDDPSAIEVNGLVKTFNGFRAVDNISFKVRSGEIFGFLGPNGAGKTTTIKSILGLIHANSGEITIKGINIRNNEKEAKKFVGYLPERVAFYDNLTALQNLCFYAEMKNASKEECKALIVEFGLEDAMDKKVGKFSKGMTQRLGMARAVLGNPPILILDEPSGGLDPRGVILIRDKIREMKKKGSTIFVSSHILSEIQALCDRVGIINNGVLVAKDTVSHLRKRLNLKPKLTVELEDMTDKVVESVKKVEGVDDVQVINKIINIVCESKIRAKVIIAIAEADGNIINLHTTEPSLEEVFMKFTEAKQ
jgi:ABC-type multidrug transport system ATPase subunit